MCWRPWLRILGQARFPRIVRSMDQKFDPSLVLEFEQVVNFLQSRGNEVKIDPNLDRIAYLLDILGSPQLAFDAIHVAGTNGKTSTARMIESLLAETGLAVGLTTSPHLHDVRERIRIHQESIPMDMFVEIFNELQPLIEMTDSALGQHLSYFEILTAMAFSAFAEAPVAVAVVEVGLGGRLDATNLIYPSVGVITPIGMDHQQYLGDTIAEIAAEKAGIIKPGMSVVVGNQHPDALEVILAKADTEGARVILAGRDFEVLDRQLAVGGQVLSIRGVSGNYSDIVVPLHGEHQAENAALAIAAIETFFGADEKQKTLDPDILEAGFSYVTSPGRMEIVRRGPTVLLDAAHNPHGMAAMLNALESEFNFERKAFVLAAFADKDVEGLVSLLEPVADAIILTQNSNERALPVDDFAERISGIVSADKLNTFTSLTDAIDNAIAKCDEWQSEDLSSVVVVTGSVATVAQVRAMFGKRNTS
jgi:dihydrofolate synthase / folylpolyglutamate synthase